MNNQTRIKQIGNQPTVANLTHDYPTLNDDLAHWDNTTNPTVTVGQFVLTPGLKEITATGPINIFCNNWNYNTDARAPAAVLGTHFPVNTYNATTHPDGWKSDYNNYCCVFNACKFYVSANQSSSSQFPTHGKTWYDLCS